MPRDGTQRIYGWMEKGSRESNGSVSWRNGNAQRIALRHCRRCGVTPPHRSRALHLHSRLALLPQDNEQEVLAGGSCFTGSSARFLGREADQVVEWLWQHAWEARGGGQEGWWQRHLIAAFARGNCRSARLRLALTPAGAAPARHAPPSHGRIAACQNLLGPMRTYADLCGPMRDLSDLYA